MTCHDVMRGDVTWRGMAYGDMKWRDVMRHEACVDVVRIRYVK